jgi:hypothetical protein
MIGMYDLQSWAGAVILRDQWRERIATDEHRLRDATLAPALWHDSVNLAKMILKRVVSR